MKISHFAPVLAALLFSATTLAFATSPAQAQDGSIFGGQQSDQGETATSPDAKKPPLTVSGSWTGTIDDNLAGSGTLDVDFTEAPNGALTGDWSFMFSEGTDFGTITGKATSKKVAISFIFVPKAPYIHCKFSMSDAHATDTDISGHYHFTACGPLTKKEHGTLMIAPE
ncbi:MAG: hypothetical protein WAU82_03420 [Candidatus Binatus sp.]|uniref:hypothetical protein n=1 Tax=Candidatus Binatus sp. TaxID=2811406 RepID=UPI003BB20DAE